MSADWVLSWCAAVLVLGKTMLARACAAKTKSCFLKLAAPQLVQMFIGDGAKLVRDAFALAREKAPAIIFIVRAVTNELELGSSASAWLVLMLDMYVWRVSSSVG